jgi:hypothetical protein
MVAAPNMRQVPPQPIAPPDASQAALMRISAATPQEQPVVLQSMQAGVQPAQASVATDSPAVSQATAAELPAVDAAFVF